MSEDKDADVKAIAKKFFAAYDAHDVEWMLALCAADAQGRYTPYGRDSVVPIRAGLDGIWRAFPHAVPRVEIVEMLAEGNTAIIQAVMSGPIPADVPGIAKKAQVVFIPHAYFSRFKSRALTLIGTTPSYKASSQAPCKRCRRRTRTSIEKRDEPSWLRWAKSDRNPDVEARSP